MNSHPGTRPAKGKAASTTFWRLEQIGIALILLLVNFPLLVGQAPVLWEFDQAAVNTGEWWRVLTYPLSHVSLYHLVLDAAAFFLAYQELQSSGLARRLLLFQAASAGSLLAAILCCPDTANHGLAGLSGVAHGLTAVVGLQLISDSRDKLMRWAGILSFVAIVGKGVMEALQGRVLFASWHLGSLGVPIAACHAGGILGALCAWIFCSRSSWTNLRMPRKWMGLKTPVRWGCSASRYHGKPNLE